jgi:hypothetical protein
VHLGQHLQKSTVELRWGRKGGWVACQRARPVCARRARAPSAAQPRAPPRAASRALGTARPPRPPRSPRPPSPAHMSARDRKGKKGSRSAIKNRAGQHARTQWPLCRCASPLASGAPSWPVPPRGHRWSSSCAARCTHA